MKQKRVIVVGAGVAGLVAAIYARGAGHNVTVLEQGMRPGGLSSNWRRGKYHFEGGLHWLLGSTPKMKKLHRYWVEVGGLSRSNPVDIEDPAIFLFHNRNKLPYFRNLDTFKKELLRRSPQDRSATEILCSDIALFKLFIGAGGGMRAFFSRVIMAAPFALRCYKLWKISTDEYASVFKHSEIRTLLKTIINPAHTAIALVYTMAAYSLGDCGYPQGGSMAMTINLQERAMGKCGTIFYRQCVTEIVMDKGRVKGVISNGDFFEADEVIVSIDTRTALEKFFKDKPLNEKWVDTMKNDLVNQQCMFVNMGVRANLFRYPMNLRIMLDEPLEIGGAAFDCLEVYNYADMIGYAPYNCTSLTIILRADCYDYWKEARLSGSYLEKKRLALAKVVKVMSEKIPEIGGKIEVEEMATPLTYEFYTSSYKGGWMSILQPGKIPQITPLKCRSVHGLHFVGQRTMLAGGLPAALLSGRAAALSIKK